MPNMEFEFLLDYRALDTEAEIFWDLPLDAEPSCEYIVYLDEKQAGRPERPISH